MKTFTLTVILLCIGATTDLEAQCSFTSLKSPQDAYDFDAHNGTDEATWLHSDGAKASTNLCILGGCAISAQLTSILSIGDKNTEYLVAQNFTVNVPETAVICGIEVVIRKHSLGLNERVSDVSLKLRKNGAAVGSNKKKTGKWTAGLTSYTYGGPNDLWGTTWTPANINATNFGLEFAANVDYTFSLAQLLSLDISLLPQAHVDHIGVIVYYANPLPVELIQFDGIFETEDEHVNLNWSIGSESENDFYTVERSTDAVNYHQIGIINGSGNSATKMNYAFVDKNPLPGINYYRLKQTSFNGDVEFFGPITVNYPARTILTIAPNPANTGFRLHFSAEPSSTYSMVLLDMYGKEMERASEIEPNHFVDCSGLLRGLYFVRLYENGTMVAREKVLVE